MPNSSNDALLTLELVEKDRLTEDVAMLTFAAAGSTALPSWEPGAHIEFHLKSGLKRQYSLCGDLHAPDTYVVCVLRQEGGRGGSREIHDELGIGEQVVTSHPRNHFALADAAEYVLFAGGIGITPIKAMAAHLDEQGHSWKLFYGGRSVSSMAFAKDLAVTYPDRVVLLPQDEHGLPDVRAIVAGMSAKGRLFCCGPEAMLRAVREACEEAGVGDRLHFERFGAAAVEDTAPPQSDGAFEVILERSGATVSVESGQTILEAVRDIRPDVDFSCEEGYCGSCETRVLAGQPEHRGSLMTPEEHDAEGTMLICVGRARSSTLVLDL